MAEKETKESKAIEYLAISPEIFPDFKGEVVVRDLRIKDTNFKLSFSLPVPETDEAVAEMYGLGSASEVRAIAVKQISYSRDTALRKHLNDNGASIDWENADGTAEAKIFEADLKTPPERKVSERTAKAKERDKKLATLDGMMSKFGVTDLDELKKILAKIKK